MKLPKAEQGLEEWQTAVACLIGAAEGRDLMMHARIGGAPPAWSLAIVGAMSAAREVTRFCIAEAAAASGRRPVAATLMPAGTP